jgi:CO/xanthine dehydrogenase Mo-binding subunit
MTELLNKEFSRKSFVKGGGALIVGFSLLGVGAKTAKGQVARPLFDQNQVDAWLMVHADNTATVLGGRVELGQGVSMGLMMIAGEELDMSLSQLRYANEETGLTPSIGGTGGSNGVKDAGRYVRAAAANARQELMRLASERLGVAASSLTVRDGIVSGGGRSISYGELIGDKFFNVKVPVVQINPGQAPAKSPSMYTLVGTSPPRVDIPAKVTGSFVRVHDIKVPGMLHARVVRPRGQGAWGDGTNPAVLSVDASSIRHIPEARVVRKGNFVAVVAPNEYDAIRAAAELKVRWAEMPTISSNGNMWKFMRELDSAGNAPARLIPTRPDWDPNINLNGVDAAIASAAAKVSSTFMYGYETHGHIGPHCCVADVRPDGATIFSNTQSSYGSRDHAANLLGLPPESVRVKFVEGGGGFGRGGGTGTNYNEPTGAAALISQAVGKPVRLQYMRHDDFGWQFYGAPLLYDIRGGVDANGNIVGIDVTSMIPAQPAQGLGLAGNALQQMVGMPLGQATSGVIGGYHTYGGIGAAYHRPTARSTYKTLQLENNFFKTTTIRSPLGPATVWAFEQFIDELAYAAKKDPVEFRRQNVTRESRPDRPWFHTDRWLGVLNSVAAAAKWEPHVAASRLSDSAVVTGRGVAMSTHATSSGAAVAHIEVNKKTGKVVVKDLWTTVDLGLSVNPEGVTNQAVGGAIMATSRVLNEQVRFNTKQVTSLDWVGYPILRFKDHPRVHPVVIQRMDQIPAGGGESSIDPVVGAIANAFFDATGVRMRTAPLRPASVLAALRAAGVK